MSLAPDTQEKVAFFIVGSTGVYVFFRWAMSWVRPWLARRLLQAGRVKWAMRLHARNLGSGCEHERS